MKYPMRLGDALAYERLYLRGLMRDLLAGKASEYEKRLIDVKATAVANLRNLVDKYGEDAVIDADGEVVLRPATEEEVEDHVDAEVSEDMRLATEQCDPFNFN